jgi:pimeloyl-ACP methyl ester carboxylesterase
VGDSHRYAYLHGFASSSLARKGAHLRAEFGERGIDLELPDLNVPSFQTMNYDTMLEALTARDSETARGGPRWRFIGSSMGGYLAARWAQLHAERVDRLVLLCPGFDLASRWTELIGEEAMRRWRTEGHLDLPDATGEPRPVRWSFVEVSRRHPSYPAVPCPTLILHGTRDEIVSVQSSRDYARRHAGVRLIELDDDHSLAASYDRITEESLAFFGL